MTKKKDYKLKSFNPEQEKEINQIVDSLASEIVESIQESLPQNGNDNSDIDFSKDKEVVRKDRKNLRVFDSIWKQAGRISGSDARVSIDTLFEKDREVTKQMSDNFSSDHPLLIPRIVSNMAREAIEPNQVLTSLLTRLNFTNGTRIVFPAWGGFHAADIAEGAEYPERTMELAGQVEATIGKSGVAVKVSEEMVRYSQYDVLGLHIRAAVKALLRHKESKVAALITADYGNVIFDNQSSSYKSTTGRNAAGTYNGTLTLDDLFYAYAAMVDRGFTPNTIIMHPLAWQIFAQEGISKAFGFTNGINPLLWQLPQGSPGNAPEWKMGGLNSNSYVSSPSQLATTFTNVPSIFPTNFRIVVSPYMPFTASTSLTDIVFCDAAELGMLIVDEEVTTDEWEDKARDLKKIKFRERYGLAVANDGKGIGLMKSIKVGKSYDFANQIALSFGTGDLGSPLSGDIGNTANPPAL